MFSEQDRNKLKSLLKTHSVLHGDFILSSGQPSKVYVDAKLTTLLAEAMPLVGRAFLDAMRKRGWRPSAVGGLSLGADPIVCAIARESLDFPPAVDAFLIRKEAKEHGRRRFVEGVPEAEGKKVIIIEDVCTTGGATIRAIEHSRVVGLEVLGSVCLVDREQGGSDVIKEEHHCPFERIFTLQELLPGEE